MLSDKEADANHTMDAAEDFEAKQVKKKTKKGGRSRGVGPMLPSID